ncbi:MAG: GC-type dockerin domain-anchored protein, partial [Phycisphaerales bacterium]
TAFERCADLAVGDVAVPAGPFAPGDSLSVGFDVENLGGIDSGATTYELLVSADPIPGGDAAVFGPFSLSAVSGGSTRQVSRTITLPASLASGSYYIGAIVDDDGAFNDWAFTTEPVTVSASCSPADLAAPFGSPLDIDDVLAFLNAFAARDPAADLAPPTGSYDIDDVLLFLTTFAAGCP